jgi:hypothetical protein
LGNSGGGKQQLKSVEQVTARNLIYKEGWNFYSFLIGQRIISSLHTYSQQSTQPQKPPSVIKMKFTIILTALTAGIAMAAPAPEAANDVAAAAPQACLPASCQSFGVRPPQ